MPADEQVRLSTDGLHGPVRGYQLATDGLVFEGGGLAPTGEVPTMHRAEGMFSRRCDPSALSETKIGVGLDEPSVETLAGKFIVRK